MVKVQGLSQLSDNDKKKNPLDYTHWIINIIRRMDLRYSDVKFIIA